MGLRQRQMSAKKGLMLVEDAEKSTERGRPGVAVALMDKKGNPSETVRWDVTEPRERKS